MEQKPRKRYGALIFSLVFLAIAGGIVATVLLANDRRNLRVVLRQIGYETRTMVIPKPGALEAFKGKRISSGTVHIPGQMFLPPVINRDSAFLRTLEKKDGEGLCVELRKQGFDMTPWEGGAFARSVLECSYEASRPNATKPDDPSTFFMMIKGSAEGDLFSARAKIVITSFDAQAEFAKRGADVLKAFALHTRWLDLGDGLSKVASLQPFTLSSHGITARFQPEFSGPGRYNLILAPSSPLTAAQQRTRDYFERKRYWPLLPEHGGPKVVVKEEPVEG
ncbi:DUF6030 family protein [Rhizobium sp.]